MKSEKLLTIKVIAKSVLAVMFAVALVRIVVM